MAWYDWLLIIFGLLSIGFIFWFCLKKNHESYNSSTPKHCGIIIILSLILILLTMVVILTYI